MRGLVWLLVVLGLGARAYHFLRGRPIWHDEAALVLSVLDLDFAGLLGPLHFHEAAPPLFLWLIKAFTLVLGDSEMALRLVPFLASCAALVLLVPVARRVLPEVAVPWAVLLFAFSDELLGHASETKSYTIDVLVALALVAAYLRGPSPRAVLLVAVLAPLMVWCSFPACFLLGGLLLALLPPVVRSPGWTAKAAYAFLGATVATSFLALLLGPIRAQHDAVIHSDWVVRFMPDWEWPWAVPGWVVVKTTEVFRYACDPTGGVLFPVALLGTVVLVRAGRGRLVVALTAPLGLALVAACLHRYPYGGARVMAFAAPAVVLLLAAGLGASWTWCADRKRWLFAPLAALALAPVVPVVQGVLVPSSNADVPSAAAFVAGRYGPGERVIGNDWTHGYYFRHLGPLFSFAGAQASASGPVWVVWTQKGVDHAQRLALAQENAPPGWVIDQHGESFATSVARFRPPQPVD